MPGLQLPGAGAEIDLHAPPIYPGMLDIEIGEAIRVVVVIFWLRKSSGADAQASRSHRNC